MEHPTTSPTNTASAVLATLGLFFKSLSELPIESVYNWFFRVLSVISLILIIIINYPKAKETLKTWKKNGNH